MRAVRFTCSVNVHVSDVAGEMARPRMAPNARRHYRLCVRNMRKNLPERPRTRRTPRPAHTAGSPSPGPTRLPRTRTRHASRWGPGAEQPLRAIKTFIPVYHLGGPRPSSTPIPQIKSQFTEVHVHAAHTFVPRSVSGICEAAAPSEGLSPNSVLSPVLSYPTHGLRSRSTANARR